MTVEEELNQLRERNKYLEEVADKHFHRKTKGYGIVNMEDGLILSEADIKDQASEWNKRYRNIQKTNKVLLMEEELTSTNIKNKQHERRFLKMYYVSFRNLTQDLDPLTLGLFQKLIQHIRIDGSNGLIGSSIKKDWYDITGIPKATFDKHFNILIGINAVKFVRNQGIFINPYYARYGNIIENSTLDMFGLCYDVVEGLIPNPNTQTPETEDKSSPK